MKKIIARLVKLSLLIALVIISNGCFKNLTQKYLLYANDFERGDLMGMEVYDINGPFKFVPIEDFNGSKVLGRFNNNRFIIHCLNIPTHNSIQVEFTLHIHDKWEGNHLGPTNLPDIWQMNGDDKLILLTTFSNNAAYLQAFPNYYQGLNVSPLPAQTSADITNEKGVCSLQGVAGGTTTYKIVKIIQHWDKSFVLSCNDALQPFNSLCLKSWSIDDISITAIKY